MDGKEGQEGKVKRAKGKGGTRRVKVLTRMNLALRPGMEGWEESRICGGLLRQPLAPERPASQVFDGIAGLSSFF